MLINNKRTACTFHDGAIEQNPLARRVALFQRRFRRLLQSYKGKTVIGLGAPAKSVTLLTACGIGAKEISFIVDATPCKAGRLLPGAHIPIYPEAKLKGASPDCFVLLAWNYREILLKKARRLAGPHVPVIIPFPELTIVRT